MGITETEAAVMGPVWVWARDVIYEKNKREKIE